MWGAFEKSRPHAPAKPFKQNIGAFKARHPFDALRGGEGIFVCALVDPKPLP
jgi:hypothetical protein